MTLYEDEKAKARLETILEAYGADPRRWPAAETGQMQDLLASSSDARRIRDEAAELDRWLDEMPGIEPSEQLIRRVLKAAPEPVEHTTERVRPRRKQSWLQWLDDLTERAWPFSPRWQPTVALAAAAIFGVVLGASLPDSEYETDSNGDDVVELAFGSEADWSDLQ